MELSNFLKKGVFIIAELSANHGSNFKTAIESIREAKKIGANAIKLQTYTPDTITIDSKKEDFKIKDNGLWHGQYLYDLYKDAHTPWDWHKELFRVAKEEGIICFSSPSDATSVEFLESLNCPIYKIPSFEITDIPLIKHVSNKQKPIIFSTGIADNNDIELAINTCKANNNNQIALLKCTSSYPAPIDDANLKMIPYLKEKFSLPVGLSDHSKGHLLPVIATALGAQIIEKHFILDKSINSPDSAFSLDKDEFAEMIKAVREAEKSLGEISEELSKKQILNRQFSRSLYVVCDIEAGETISDKNIRPIRPGNGAHPKHFEEILGKKAKKKLERGTALRLEDIN